MFLNLFLNKCTISCQTQTTIDKPHFSSCSTQTENTFSTSSCQTQTEVDSPRTICCPTQSEKTTSSTQTTTTAYSYSYKRHLYLNFIPSLLKKKEEKKEEFIAPAKRARCFFFYTRFRLSSVRCPSGVIKNA